MLSFRPKSTVTVKVTSMTFNGIFDEQIQKLFNEAKAFRQPGQLSFLKTHQECQATVITSKYLVGQIF